MIHLKLTIMALLWAGGFIVGKQITYQAGPFTVSFLRFFVSAIILAFLVYKREGFTKINPAMFAYVLGAAFFGIFSYNYLFFSGIKYIEAGRGSVIISMVPIVVALISYLLFRERINIIKFLGIVLSLLGAWVVISKGQITMIIGYSLGRGEVYILACMFCAAAFTLLSRQILKRLSPMVAMSYISALGAAFLLFPALIEIGQIPVEIGSYSFFLNLLYLSVGPSVIAATFYCEAIKKVGPSRASQYMNLIPVFSVVLAFVFLGEQLSTSLIIGGGFVTTGLYLTNMTT